MTPAWPKPWPCALTCSEISRIWPATWSRLKPPTEAVLEDYLPALADPELSRLTGTHVSFERAQVEQWLSSRTRQHDRADWAVLRGSDGAFLGEAVLNDYDPPSACTGSAWACSTSTPEPPGL